MKLLSLSVFSLVLLAGCGPRQSAESGDGAAAPAASAQDPKAEGGCCGGAGGSCCADKSGAPAAGDDGCSCCGEAPAPGGTTEPAAPPRVPLVPLVARHRFSTSGQ
jgi:hypothetical protein